MIRWASLVIPLLLVDVVLIKSKTHELLNTNPLTLLAVDIIKSFCPKVAENHNV